MMGELIDAVGALAEMSLMQHSEKFPCYDQKIRKTPPEMGGVSLSIVCHFYHSP